jgi:uncharacterized SAM-binding protein YcdF (DUF218 family)
MPPILGTVAWYVLSVGSWLVLLLLAGALLRRRGRGAIGIALVEASAIGFAIVLFLPVGGWAIAPLENRFPVPTLPSSIDGIVLLTGAVNVKATLARKQPIFYPYAERITTAVSLARRFPSARIVIAGGRDRPGEPSAAAVHRELLVALGIDGSRIETENRSRNTCENASFSYRQVRPRKGERWILVTSAFHLPRAVACFRHVGWDVIPYPAGYKEQDAAGVGLAGNLHVLRLALHEWVGLVGYYLEGRIDDVFPGPEGPRDLGPIAASHGGAAPFP